MVMGLRQNRFAKLGILALSLALLNGIAFAQTFPSKPITLVVPFSAGGPTDAIARLIAVPMAKEQSLP